MAFPSRIVERTGTVPATLVTLAAVAVLFFGTNVRTSGALRRSADGLRTRSRTSADVARFRAMDRLGLLPTPRPPDGWEYTMRGRWVLLRRIEGRSHVTVKPADGGWRVTALDEAPTGERERVELTDIAVPFHEAVDLATRHAEDR